MSVVVAVPDACVISDQREGNKQHHDSGERVQVRTGASLPRFNYFKGMHSQWRNSSEPLKASGMAFCASDKKLLQLCA